MARLHTKTFDVETDAEGFLKSIDEWNDEIAEALAEAEGVAPLNDIKRYIIRYLREYYLRNHNFPILRSVCRKIHASSGDCITDEFIDPMKAWKVAGLPKPPQVFFTSFDGKHFFANPFY